MVNFLKGIVKSEHERIAEMLSEYMDGALIPAQEARVEAHLAECEDCAQNLRTLRQTVGLLGQLPSVKAPRSFVIREAQVAPRPRPRVGMRLAGPWTWGYPALQGATVLAFLLFVVVFAGDVAFTHFAPAMGDAPLVGYYYLPANEEAEAQRVAQEKVAEETVAMTATADGMPVPPAPTGTPAPAAAEQAEPTPTLVSCEGMHDAGPPTEEARIDMAERTAEATPPPPAEATPSPEATPVKVAEATYSGGENEVPLGDAFAAVRSPLVSPARVALWVIEGGLLVLAVALLAVTVRMHRWDWS
jgi:hypothetical protein